MYHLTNQNKTMYCVPLYHGNDLYYVFGYITLMLIIFTKCLVKQLMLTLINQDKTMSSHIRIMIMICTMSTKSMSCKHSHHSYYLYDVSGNIIYVYVDLSGQNPCLTNIHIMQMICTVCLVT